MPRKMAPRQRQPHAPPMTLGNMRELGVPGLAVHCLNQARRNQAVISADDYADDIEIPSFRLRMKCGKCGGRNVDVRPNWKEQPRRVSTGQPFAVIYEHLVNGLWTDAIARSDGA
jgi:hypothetical protein